MSNVVTVKLYGPVADGKGVPLMVNDDELLVLVSPAGSVRLPHV